MISKKGIDLIKQFEGFKDTTYLDVVGIATIGFGTTRVNGCSPATGMKCTEAEAEVWLKDHLVHIVQPTIDTYVKVVLGQNQEDALYSFIYNVGAKNFINSTLLKLLNNGKYVEAADQLLRWDKAGGKVVKGLTTRRIAERKLFLNE